jgi:hypothetical protein
LKDFSFLRRELQGARLAEAAPRHSEATTATVQGKAQLMLELVVDIGIIHVILVLQA